MSNIFNIPAGIPFAKALTAQLLREHKDTPETLPDILILLPTRRACRTLREAFLQLNAGKPIMLPAMQALGDIDEEELSLSIAGQNGTKELLTLPAVLSGMQRQILLARAILKHEDFPHGFDQALNLAKTLGHLLDQIYTEDLDIKDLSKIVPEDFADHWQITLDFLKILSEEWPKILQTLNVIDAADRRNRLINKLSDFWQDSKPQKRVIAAGTTGSIPATARLLEVIANLPNGQIILPGLDDEIDEQSWETLSESHPQYGFKHLLATININRESVQTWPTSISDNAITKARRKLSSELMRPSETTHKWQEIDRRPIQSSIENLKLFDCETPQHEAQIIATMMRETLEQSTKTAALITPDRNLAKRVAMACLRWGIKVDDSAGTPLTQTQIGRFINLTIETCEQALSPTSLLSALKHPLTNQDIKSNLQHFETKILRGIKPAKGIKGLYQRAEDDEDLKSFIKAIEEMLSPMIEIFDAGEKVAFKTLLQTHIQMCEALHKGDKLWAGEDGTHTSKFLSEILTESHSFPDIHPAEYAAILKQFMAGITLRPAYGTHPRLQILGQLEARLIDADLVILGGLNEGTWPSEPDNDPWMSRPMRKEFGLPVSERSIGLSAHDFAQGLCAPNVAITRAKRADGAPTIPARWLGRLETVLTASDIDIKTLHKNDIMDWVNAIDESEKLTPYKRPAPTPPKDTRPNKLSITKIETLLKDPYSIYAHSILKLSPLDPLEKEADAALRGQILHDTLDNFITHNPISIPDSAADIILKTAQDLTTSLDQDEEDWHFYWPRFSKIAQQFVDKETKWREDAKPLKTEINGQITLTTNNNDFTLYGRADRLDKMHGGVAIIDYKSGGAFSKKSMESGDNPQLPLEALIAESGGFENIPATPCAYLGYWVLNGGGKYTEITFNNEKTPYFSLPRAQKIPRFNDYEHLARVKEWAALDDVESGEAA